jgi:hypothetical protein
MKNDSLVWRGNSPNPLPIFGLILIENGKYSLRFLIATKSDTCVEAP